MVSGIAFKRLGLFMVLLFMTFSCKKPEDRRCWKSLGKTETKRIDLPDFSFLNLKKKMNYILIQDDSNYLIIKGGKNLLNFIKTEINSDGFLVISNSNKCDFLRDKSNLIDVEIHFKNLSKLRYEGSENLNTPDTIQLNSFEFVVLDACGTLNMTVNANYISGDVAYGWGDFNLRGKTKKALLGVSSNGYCDVSALKIAEELEIKSDSPGDMYVNADQLILKGYLANTGNLYYLGKPKSIDLKILSSGKAIAY